MQDMIGKLSLQTRFTTSFWYNILYVLTLITRKLEAVYGRCTYQTTALPLEMSIFWVRAACEIWLVSCDSKHASQSLPADNPFVCIYIHNLKTTGRIWMLRIFEWLLYYQRHSVCGLELHEELHPQTSIGCSLIQHCVHILQAISYIAIWCGTMHDNTTHVAYDYYTPNDGFTANDALFYKNKVG